MTTMLDIVKEFCTRRALPLPNIVMSSQDDQLLQIKGLLHQVLEDLSSRKVWQRVAKEATFLALAAESQGSLQTLAPGLKWIINGTFWNRTRRLQVNGPVSAVDWAVLKGTPMTSPFLQYRIREDQLLLAGSVSLNDQMAFEYSSEYLVQAADNTYKQYFTKDDDKALVKDSILLAGLTWMWKEAKGFKYAEDFRRYEALVADQAGHDTTRGPISLDGGSGQVSPGIMIPLGNWTLP